MPPRFAYWTILIDNGPTAFRALLAEDLLPTLRQLQRTNPNVVMKWFSGGELWDSPEAARNERQRRRSVSAEKRGAAWRPGGAHADPRDRFRRDKEKKRERPWSAKQRPWNERERPRDAKERPHDDKERPRHAKERPWREKDRPRNARPFRSSSSSSPRPPRRPR